MQTIADRRGLNISWTTPLDLPPCLCDPRRSSQPSRTQPRQNVPFLRMHSGAGHDTQNMAKIAKVAMVFAEARTAAATHRQNSPRSTTPSPPTRVLAATLYKLAW